MAFAHYGPQDPNSFPTTFLEVFIDSEEAGIFAHYWNEPGSPINQIYGELRGGPWWSYPLAVLDQGLLGRQVILTGECRTWGRDLGERDSRSQPRPRIRQRHALGECGGRGESCVPARALRSHYLHPHP
eukprot:COSAG01_NODE_942_length_12551_cov_47.129216_16_plen_129_part_00